MAQFVTHIQPTLLEASQGHVPHHHGHQVGMQHTSHLPHSGHNMPSPPTSHNHHPHSHHQQHQEQQHHNHRHSPPSQLSSPPSGAPIHHYHMGKHGAKHEHFGHHSSGDGNTSFLRAARAGNLERVLEHLKNNIDINTSNTNGLNALHLASKDGHTHVVSELLKRGAIVDSATKKGNTALHIASLAGQEEVVKLLLEHNAAVNVQSQNGFTPLYMAAQENHDSVVKLLLANGANQSLATEDGFTPLAVAMQQGHDKVVAVLLESDTRGKVRLPALHIAAKKDDVKAATLLLDNDHNPDVTSKSGFTPLHIASHYGNQAIATLLIQKGADVNFAAKHNISPLHVAAKWGKTNMVSLLLEKGANIEAKTRDGLTPLHCAARSGHEQVVDMLLERGAPISAKTKNGLAPLHMAAQGEHVDAARILLYHRAPVDEVTVDYLTALHVAAHCGHVRVAKLLLDRNADANARALNGFTPLHIACKKNRIKVVELLLRHGASISATTESGLTPLHVAAFMGCMNIVIYLLQHDASPDVPTVRGETPLHLAARANQTDIIRILLRNGAQVDARAREQQTPLHIASRLGNVDIVMLLLQHGAQVDATTKDMYTALHIAAKEGQDEVAAVLIENGAALDAATKKGFTPLHLTAKYGHIKVAQLLLQKEADVDAQGKNGVTPLHVACHYDNQKVALLLLEKGASPHAIAKNGHTPLHIAARKNQMDIATTLLEYGAQANAESKAGFTPLHLSCQEGHAEISNLLIEHKAGVNHPAKNGLTPMHLCAQEDNVNVAEILQRNGANIDMATKAGYTPLHVAAHFGQANMVRFLLHHGANVDAATSIGYTPLHQTAQQGHCHIVNLLLEHKANANAQTVNGQTPLHIARKLGYISVLDSLKSITNEPDAAAQTQTDEKYRVVAPEAMHESFMSDSEEEGGDTNDWDPCYGIKGDQNTNEDHVYLPYYQGEAFFMSSEDNMLSDQPYRYLTVDEMKSLGDDSLPIDVTRDERIDSNRMMTHSAEYAGGVGGPSQPQAIAEELISPHKAQVHGIGKSYVDGIYMGNGLNEEQKYMSRKLSWKSFLVSFLVDARGGAMRGCRHSGVRMIIPSRSTCQPTRVTCRYVKPQRTMHPPQLMEGEALASRVLELGPVSTKFIGPVIMEVPHFASLRGKEREIIILRSDNGETWREHTVDNSEEIMHDVLQQCFEPEEIAQLEEQGGNHVCRFVTYDFPQYFAVVSRIRQEVHAIGPEGGMVSSTVVPQVQAVFPQGALTKKIKVGLQAQPVDPDLTAKLLGRGVAVSPIVTVEPRRRKFHKAITLSMPAPKAHSQGMINQYSGNTPTLRLLCSITGVFRKRSLKGGPSRAQWEDVTGSTPLTFVNDCVSFTTTVSARFWLMDCRNISEATKMATELYKEVIHVPFMAKFVVFAKKVEPYEARLRVFCMTDDREDKTLEKQELFTEVAKSRDVEVLEGKPQYIEMAGNLVPVTKSGDQLQLQFKAFRENRLPFTVRVKDQHADIVGRTLFMKEPKVAKGEPPQHPICILNIVLPDIVIPDTTTEFSDKITTTYRSSLFSLSKHQNDHYIGDIRIVDLSNLLGKDWIQLASEIGISTEEIDDIINQNTDSIARQAQSMIRLFKDKPNYDIHALEDALKNIGREDIMKKCKSGRLSHSRDFDETDIMKNSESVEELVRQESKRIQQIHDHEEVKYSAEEKEVEESESDEEITKRTVAERREKIVKRLSIERQIPASSQKKEISREISEIKRKSLIEDKKAIHESEIMMQLPTDNIVKSTVAPDQVMKMKMGKMDAAEISKSDFDKELTHKLKTSGRSSEEEDSATEYKTVEDDENLKIVQDISAVEKSKKLQDSPMESGQDTTKQLTEDFLNAEKQTQLPVDITFSEKFVEEVKEKEMKSTELDEKSSQKIEKIISVFESGKSDEKDGTVSKTSTITETIQVVTEGKVKGTSIEDKIADFEAKGVTYDMKSVLPKDIKKYEDTHADDLYEAHQEPIKSFEKTITEDFLALEQKSQMSPAIKSIQEITTAVQLPKDNADVIESAPAAPVAEKRTSLSEKSSEPITRSSIEIQSSKFSIPDGKEEKVFPKTTETIKEFEKHIEKDSEIATSELSYMEQRSQKEITKTASEFVTSTAAVLETTADSFEITTDLELPVKEAERTKAQLKEVTKEWDGITLTGIQKTSGDLTKPEHIEDKLTTEQVTTVFKSKDSSMEPRSVAKTEVITTTTYLDKTEAKVIKDSEIDDLIEFTKQREGAKETQVESKTVKTTQILNIFETESDSSTIQSAVGDIAADTKITSEILKTGKEISTIEPKELSSAFSGERDPLDMRFDDTKHEQTTKKLTQDFLLMEQQKQLPYSKESQAEDEKFELLKSATHTVVPSILSSTVVPAIPTDLNVKQEPTSLVDVQATLPDIASKEGQPTMDDTHTVETKSAMSDLIKSTSVIMATVPKVSTEEAIISLEESLTDIKREEKPVQLPTASKKFTQGSQPETTPKDFEPEIIIDEKTTTLKMSSAVTDTVKEESIKLVESIKKLEETIKVVDKHQDDGIELAAPVNETDKVSAVGIRKLTEDFLTIEQTKQFSTSTKPVRETIVTDDHEKSTVSTTYEKPEVKADSFSSLQSAGLSEEITKIVTEAATKIDAIKMTNDFLATEQSTQLPIVKQTSEQTADQLDTQISPKSALDLAAPAPVEPRKSITLTDAEFCKSVEETITKKMSAGQIEICDELKTSASDIPHSQTPPPTPIDTRTERQEEESLPRAKFVEKDNLSDTVVTLHKTTESTFERVSGISKIETIEEKLVLDEDSFRNIGTSDPKHVTEDSGVAKSRRIDHKFEKLTTNFADIDEQASAFDANFDTMVQDDEISNLQSEFSKMSWDDSVSPTTNTLGDIGQNTPDNDIQDIATETGFEFAKSSETTPVPTSAPTSAPTGHDAPTPKPRAAKSTSPVRDIGDDLTQYQKSDDAHSITDSSEILPDLSISAPVPKPRLQMKPTDSFKNLAALVNEQSDSISLRSLDITDDISKTDEVSTEISIKSSHARDYPTTTTITTASEDRTESLEPTSEISIDDAEVDTEKSELSEGRSKTSFYIGESSRNVIIKTTPTKPDTDIESSPEAVTTKDQALEGAIEAKDVALMKEISVDSDESNDVFKEFVTMKRETDEGESKIVRQGSETRNDLLEQEPTKEKQDDSNKSCETFVITADISQPADEKKETILKQSLDDYESLKLGSAKSDKLDLELEKSEWETTEKGIPIAKPKVVHSPQQLSELPRALIDEQMVARTLEEAQESLNAANNELKFIVKDGKSIKESPSEFEFRSISNTLISAEKKDKTVTDESLMQKEIKEPKFLEEEYISSFIGIPDTLKETQPPSTFEPIKSYEGTFEERTKETLNKEAVITHYTQGNVDDTKEELKDEHGSLGFISTGTADDYSSMEAYATKEEHASLGFVSTETVEDFSSMEDYYQEKIAKASFVTEGDDLRRSPIEVTKLGDTGVFSEICTEQTMKPFEEVTHRIKSETGSVDVTNRWSVPEIDQSSSSESYYKSFDKNDSRPLSSEVDNILTQGNSSEYQTALDVSSVTREATEYISAVSTLESSSGKTISSHESMKSFDSQSETSGNLGSIDVSELSETLVASSTEPDALEAEELSRIRDLRDDDDDSDESLDIQDYSKTEQQMQKSLMKRSQEMIFKPKTEEAKPEEKHFESVMVEEFPKPKEVEKTWGLAYPMDEAKIDDGKDTDRPEDILLYHSDIRRSIDDSKLASSLDEGSILSVSMSSTSNIETVVENFEDMIGSAGSSSLTGIEAFGFPHDEQASSFPEHEDTFTMEMDSKEHSPQDSAATTPPGESRKRGHKRSESTSITGDVLKSITDKDLPVVGENKESESESDTDPYESEYTRQFRSPNERKKNKKKQAAAEMDHSFDLEKRPFTPSQLVAEVIVEDSATEEMEAEAIEEERRPSQNMQDYSNIPDITVTEDFQKSPSLEENAEGFEEKSLYKVKTQEELHKAADEPLHQQKRMDKSEETFQKLVQEQYEQKLADLQRPQAGDIDYDDYDKAPDSPDSFEMIDQPDISDDFVIIEEVAKEADEADLGGKSIKIQPTKYESKHDEDVEKIIIKSAPADPKLGSQIFRDDLNFEFEESPPTAGSSSDPQDESDSGDMAASNKRWVEMQLTDSQLRYPYDITGGVLEDIKEEDGEFEVGSSRISSFKDSFSSTPEYDAMAARRYYARGEHDDLSMNSLQEFESLEQAISLENRNKTHQGSTDSSNGSFTRRYMVRHSGSATAQGDDISISSLKEFEGLENACIEAHLIEIKAKEEAAMLSRSDDSNKSNESDRENGASNIVVSKVTRTVTRTEVLPAQQQTIEALLKQKLEECEGRESMTKLTEMSTEPMEGKMKLDKQDSEKGSVDSLEINKSLDMRSSSIGSFEISKDATTRSDIDSLETDRKQPTREESIDSMENEQFDLLARFPTGETTLGEGLTTTTTTTTTTTDAEGHEHIVTQTITTTTSASGSTNLEFPTGQLHKDVSADSLCIEQTNTSSAGTTATYQTSAGNSQMSGSVTSCASSTLMEDSYPGANSSLTSSSFWSHEESTVVEDKNVLEEVLLEDAEALKRRQAQHRQEYDDQH
ncbi:ankyrin-2 isoform X10 [Bactrocera neohumeralis]|uniref:ankyrin-2 isoform X10 n=1 Tax=Bactrocera neohumeralis TaxID=98809 RepID=UPI002165D196|nr:ankyrin-2 isoform X10 [Bactrocera neohumeralis]